MDEIGNGRERKKGEKLRGRKSSEVNGLILMDE